MSDFSFNEIMLMAAADSVGFFYWNNTGG